VRGFLHDELLDALPTEYDRSELLAARCATYVIHQDITYTYPAPIDDLRQRLMVVPKRHHGDQQRLADSVDVRHAETGSVRRHHDRFDNTVVELEIPHVEREVTFQMRAVVRRQRDDTLQQAVDATHFHGTTHLTSPDSTIADAARTIERGEGVTSTVRAMSSLVRGSFEYVKGVTGVQTTATEAWAHRRGVCQDMAHVMLAMCASLGIPARYVSGHLVGDGASHAWIEAFDPATGEVLAVDPTHDRLTDLRYITTATGRDYADVSPTRGTYASANGRGTLSVRKSIRLADIE
jgi:transglutaminase-like putative cysteine protease